MNSGAVHSCKGIDIDEGDAELSLLEIEACLNHVSPIARQPYFGKHCPLRG